MIGRPPGRLWTALLVGTVAALFLVFGFGPAGLVLPRGQVCQLGAELGTYTIWTPLQIINIPDGGNVSYANDEWNVTVTSGSLNLNVLVPQTGPITGSWSGGSGLNRAGIAVMYGDFNWTIFNTENSSAIAASNPCTQPYVAELVVPGGACGGFAYLPLPDNTTDTIEPHVWNGTAELNGTEQYRGCPIQTPGTYVWFDSSLHLGGSRAQAAVNWSLCGDSGFEPLVLNGIAEVPVALHVPYQGEDVSVSATLEWYDSQAINAHQGPTVSYLVPGGWDWTLAPVGQASSVINPDLPLPSLVAFERTAC
jgi:hypothetical protein